MPPGLLVSTPSAASVIPRSCSSSRLHASKVPAIPRLLSRARTPEFGAIVALSALLAPKLQLVNECSREFGAVVALSAMLAPNFGVGPAGVGPTRVGPERAGPAQVGPARVGPGGARWGQARGSWGGGAQKSTSATRPVMPSTSMSSGSPGASETITMSSSFGGPS